MALTGGFLSLWFRGIFLLISTAVGVITLSGLAVLNGMVIISFIGNLLDQGLSLDDAIKQGSLTHLRPVLMTALVASLGFIPMYFATGYRGRSATPSGWWLSEVSLPPPY